MSSYQDVMGIKTLDCEKQSGYFYSQPAREMVTAPTSIAFRMLGKHASSDSPTSSEVQSKQARLASSSSTSLPIKKDQQNEDSEDFEEENSENEQDFSLEDSKENNNMKKTNVVTPKTSFQMHPLAHSTPFVSSSPVFQSTSFMAAHCSPLQHWSALKTEQLAAHYFNTAYAIANQQQQQDFVPFKQEQQQQHYPPTTYATNLPFNNSSSSSGFHSSSTDGMQSLFGGLYGQSAAPNPHQSQLTNYEPFCTSIFCTVPGRLTLLSNNKKYRVTMGEVQRRIRAKNKDGGKVLRDALKQHGLTLPSGRRKSSATTSFTSLVEEEAMQLAKDFMDISNSHYPFKAAAKHALGIQKFVQRISDFHQADRSPIADQRSSTEMVLGAQLQKGLTNYSMLTHGFGGEAIKVALNVINNCISDAYASGDTLNYARLSDETCDSCASDDDEP